MRRNSFFLALALLAVLGQGHLRSEQAIATNKRYTLTTDLIGFRPFYKTISSPIYAAGSGSEFSILEIDAAKKIYRLKFTKITATSKAIKDLIGQKIEEFRAILGGELSESTDMGNTFLIDIQYLNLSTIRSADIIKFTAGLLVIPAKLVIVPGIKVEAGGVLGPYIGYKIDYDKDTYGSFVVSTGPSFKNDAEVPIDWYFAGGFVFQVSQTQFGIIAGYDIISRTQYASLSTGFAFMK